MAEIILLIGDDPAGDDAIYSTQDDEMALYVDRNLVATCVRDEDCDPIIFGWPRTVFQILQLMKVKSPTRIGIFKMEDLDKNPDHTFIARFLDEDKQPVPHPHVLTDELFLKYRIAHNRKQG